MCGNFAFKRSFTDVCVNGTHIIRALGCSDMCTSAESDHCQLLTLYAVANVNHLQACRPSVSEHPWRLCLPH